MESLPVMNNVHELAWERADCDWCGADESQVVFRGPDRLEGLPG